MYLDGQLPYGPASMNPGGQPTAGGNSALDGQPFVSQDPGPSDLSGSTFFTVPEGGGVVVSPSLADVNGVVQVPIQSRKAIYGGPQSGYGDCGSYAAAGSLPTIASRAGRGMGDLCQSGEQDYIGQTVASPKSWWPLAFAAAAVLVFGGSQR